MTSLDPEATVLREVWDRYYTTISHKDICNALAAFLFRGDEIEKQIKLLSGGEAARVQLLKLMLTKANLLLLDEPTNHLDISAVEWLEEYLSGYKKAFVVVSHDRMFLDNHGEIPFYEIEHGKTYRYAGNYTQFTVAKKELQRAAARE